MPCSLSFCSVLESSRPGKGGCHDLEVPCCKREGWSSNFRVLAVGDFRFPLSSSLFVEK